MRSTIRTRFVSRRASTATSVAFSAAVLSLVLAAGVGCKEPAPIPTTGSEVRRELMKPDSEAKVRRLIELADESKKNFDLPTMRQTLVEATSSAQKLGNHVVAAELLTVISEKMVAERWTRESQQSITAARVAATEIPDDQLSKKVAALTNLALALQRAGDKETAGAMILEADRIVDAVSAQEQRVPQMVALYAAWIKLGDPKQPDDESTPSQLQLNAAREMLANIEDPAKRTEAEYLAASEAFRGGQAKLGREFYDAAVVTAEKITDPLTKAKTLVDLYEVLHPFRNDLPIELPLQTAVDTTVRIPTSGEKQALLKRIEAQSLKLKPSAAALYWKPTATATPSATPKAAPSATPTATPTASPKSTPIATPAAAPRATPTASPTATPKPTASASATAPK